MPNWFQKLLIFLQGKKTYVIAFAGLVYAVVIVGWQQGDWSSCWELVLAALGLGGLRAGVTKSQSTTNNYIKYDKK